MQNCVLLCTFDNMVSFSAQSAHSVQECTLCTEVHIVHNVLQNAMRNETGAYCDNHGGSTCSDSATCLPISRRACRQLSRV